MVATIGYSYDGTGSRPRAFALRIQTSAGYISNVTPLKALVSGQQIGISTAQSPGYGILALFKSMRMATLFHMAVRLNQIHYQAQSEQVLVKTQLLLQWDLYIRTM